MKLQILLVLCSMPAMLIGCEMPREIPPEMRGIDPATWARLRQMQILKGGCRKAGMSQCSITITVAERLNGTCMILNREPTCVQYTRGINRKITSHISTNHPQCINMTVTSQRNVHRNLQRHQGRSFSELYTNAGRIPNGEEGPIRIPCSFERDVVRQRHGHCRLLRGYRYACVSSYPNSYTVIGHRECRHILRRP